jgi:hypothetical protein
MFALAASPVIAQGTSRAPSIPSSAKSVERFVPPGYEIETRIDRDLDGDGQQDAALLLVPICDDALGSVETFDCKAEGRMLVIVLRNRHGAFDLSVRKSISSSVGHNGDSFAGMTARGRTLRFGGGTWSCAGQTGVVYTSSYRYQAGDWFLIGTDEQEWMRTTECGDGPIGSKLCPQLTLLPGEDCIELDRSINYSTSTQVLKWTIRSITAGGDDKVRHVVVRERFAPSQLKRLVDEAFEF